MLIYKLNNGQRLKPFKITVAPTTFALRVNLYNPRVGMLIGNAYR